MKKKIRICIYPLLLLFWATAFFSCDKDEQMNPVSNNENISTILAPDELLLKFSYYNTTASFHIMLKNSEPFEWKIIKKPDWLIYYVDTLTENKAYEFRCRGELVPDTSLYLDDLLEIEIPNVGIKSIKLRFINSDAPLLKVDTLVYVDEKWTSYINFENIGGSFVSWKLSSQDPNISFSQDSGWASGIGNWPPTSIYKIAVHVDMGKYVPGQYERFVKFITDTDTFNIKLLFEVGEIKKADVPKVATISNDEKEVSYNIVNRGNMPLNWSVDQSSLPVYITTTPERGKIAAGDSVKITVKADRELLPKTNSEFDLGINIDSYQYDTYKTKIVILNYEDPKIKLNYNIIAAVQNKNTDEILIVSKSPNKLILMDFSGNIKKTKDLNYTPEAVSNVLGENFIITNGNRAYMYNINDLTQTKEYSSNYRLSHVFLTPKYIIGFCTTSQNLLIRIDRNTLEERDDAEGYLFYNNFFYNSFNDMIYCQGYDDLDGYNADTWLSTTKWSASNDVGIFVDDLWFSADGFKIYASDGKVYTSSKYYGLDVVYSGNIGISSITSIAENAKNKLLAVSSNYLNNTMDRKKVYLIDNNDYFPKSQIILPYYLFSNSDTQGYKEYSPIVRYSFINSDATKLMVFLTPHYWGTYSEIPKDNWTCYITNIK